MTDEERKQIVSDVLAALKQNSTTIDQMLEKENCADDDFFETNKGNKISFKTLSKGYNEEQGAVGDAVRYQFKRSDGKKLYPQTSSACVTMSDGDDSLDTRVKNITTEYNVSLFHPKQGINEGNKYTLETAIALVPAQYRTIGIKCSFINEAGQSETWEWKGGTWAFGNFSQVGYGKLTELESKTNGDIALSDYNSRLNIGTEFNYPILDYYWKIDTNLESDGTFTSGNTTWKSLEFIANKGETLYPIIAGASNQEFRKIAVLTKDMSLVYFGESVRTSYTVPTVEEQYIIRLCWATTTNTLSIKIKNDNKNSLWNVLETVESKALNAKEIFWEDYIAKLKVGYYATPITSVGSVYDYESNYKSTSTSYRCNAFDVVEGEEYWLQMNMQNSIRCWIVLDVDNKIISISEGTQEYKNKPYKLIIPNGGVKLIVNVDLNNSPYPYIVKINDIGIIYKNMSDIALMNSKITLPIKNITSFIQGQLSASGNIYTSIRECHTPLFTLGSNNCWLNFKTDGFVVMRWIRYHKDNCYSSTSGEYKQVTVQSTYTEADLKILLDSENGKWTNVVIGFQAKDETQPVIDYLKTQELYFEGDVPYEVTNFFGVEVDTVNPLAKSLQATSNVKASTFDTDYCVLYLPAGHTSQSLPVKMIVLMHGGGESVSEDTTNYNNYSLLHYYIRSGYAVLGVNGLAKQYATDNGLTYSRPCGNWMATDSAANAISYVVTNYNIDINGLFLFGVSQGGMTAMNLLDNTNIPFRTTVLDCPVYSMYHGQLRISSALPTLQHFYGFNSADTFSIDKVLGCDPFTRNCDILDEAKELISPVTPSPGVAIPPVLTDEQLEGVVGKRKFKGSVLFLTGTNDNLCPATMMQVVVKQIRNYGGCAELINIEGASHMIQTYTPIIGKIKFLKEEKNVTEGCKAIADWFYRYGGYKPVELL